MLSVRKNTGLLRGMAGLSHLLPLVAKVSQVSKSYDLIYANTQKALVVGAMAALLSQRPLVYHLHDILSLEHFSSFNLKLAVTLANRAALVIANSEASKAAFIAAGGRAAICHVVYNGFDPQQYAVDTQESQALKSSLWGGDSFVLGNFSRLSPWKGQHVLIDAIQQCSAKVVVLLVGDALFGEDDYVQHLEAQVKRLGLEERVHFLGFRDDIPQLMSACDLIVHTSTAPEPFGRVIVEAMLCGKPVIAARAGGAMELLEHGQTGWLSPPGDSLALAQLINQTFRDVAQAQQVGQHAQRQAQERFSLELVTSQIERLLQNVLSSLA